ncbi:O-antigen ligase family protein [Candidatus Saccharibacteria bacterium]|nr:O-antigen ligase family protein [Candidatus Saccharibacteria bacterium]
MIRLGENETMYFELSVAEIWLVVFDMVGFLILIIKKRLFRDCGKWWKWVLLPIWITISVMWSLNVTRGLLTVGVMWAIVMVIYVVWNLRDMLDEEFRRKWWKWFLGSTLVVCVWCIVQCVMDLAGVSQECTLLCDGCTYRMFGFPHPNGFAIEPQFMGNLLLAPIMAIVWLYVKRTGVKTTTGSCSVCSKFLLFCFFVTTAILFLTFSRGAIYAFVMGMCFLSGYEVMRSKKKQRGEMWQRMGVVWGVTVLAFVGALVTQGAMAEASPTNDTFGDGVAKVLNHLSLGIIKVRGADKTEVEVVEKPVENSVENDEKEEKKEEAVFDGYVAESTDTRMRLTGAAVKIWSGDFRTALIGVGIGGAGQVLYNNGLSPAPREIVQNEYASLLLETGLVGVVLLVVLVVLVIRVVARMGRGNEMILSLLVAYGVSLVFFSGLPNALQIYLMPIILMVMM